MKMIKKISSRFGIVLDWMSIIFGLILFLLSFFKIVPGLSSNAALAATIIIAYLGPIGLIMIVIATADLLKDRFFISETGEDDYCKKDEDDY